MSQEQCYLSSHLIYEYYAHDETIHNIRSTNMTPIQRFTDKYNNLLKNSMLETPDMPDIATKLAESVYDIAVDELKSIKNVILIHSDGYSIDITHFDSLIVARECMISEYKSMDFNEKGDEWDSMSEIDDMSAILYEGGENVHLWQITTFQK